jgi:CRP/FNR family transcriptional regulator, anaerobic regulatory protein
MMTPLRSGSPDELPGEVMIGRNALAAMFHQGSPRLLRAGQPLATAAQGGDVLHRLKAGWAYRFRELADGDRAIVDIYLPGDIMGFDAALCGGPVENVLTLTTAVVETITNKTGLSGLMASRPIGLCIAWLLNEQQRRTDSLRTATAVLDARGRLAAMVLDFYHRLQAQGLITSGSFNLPLTQHHIGSYLGLTVVHVNRVIRSLRDDGVVTIEKHCVTLLNPKTLAVLAKANGRSPGRMESRPFPTSLPGTPSEAPAMSEGSAASPRHETGD